MSGSRRTSHFRWWVGLALCFGGTASPAASAAPGTQADSRVHVDFRDGVSADEEEACQLCHGGGGTTDTPRWGGTSDRFASGTSGTIGAESAACVTCHDGSTHADSYAIADGFGTAAAGGTDGTASGAAFTLQDGHPVSVSLRRLEARDFGVVQAVRASSLVLYGPDRDRVECPTCHRGHATEHGVLLRISNGGSGLCFTCHRNM